MRALRPAEGRWPRLLWSGAANLTNRLRATDVAATAVVGAALLCCSLASGCAKSDAAAVPEAVKSLAATATATASSAPAGDPHYNPTALALAEIASHKVKPHDWPMWGGWTARNNTPEGKNIPIKWDAEKKTNIKWTAKLGSQTYGNPVVANGKVYVGTNNGNGYIKRYPPSVDLGCLLCFDEKTGKFLWQHSNPKLPQGRVNDWPQQGVCSTPYCDGDRLWYVTNRGEVVCLDANGFYDGKNDGPYTAEPNENKDEADVIWRYDMMAQMGVAQHNMCSCSICCVGDTLFVCTSNGVDFDHLNIPAPNAPSFFAMDRNTAKVLWTDKSPGLNILHGQWSSPTYGVFGGQAQVIFGGGDGWLYSFDPAGDGQGHGKVLWKFDCNPKDAKYSIDGRSTRNHIIATPVIYDGLIYCAVGEDPEHGPGNGHLWCIDPTKRGDVSPDLAVDHDGKPLPERRIQAVNPTAGEKAIPNPNSAAVWHFAKKDFNGDKEIQFEEEMHRTIGTAAVKDGLVYISDFSGLFHCLDAKTGERYWVHDQFSESWGSPVIVENKVYIGDADGDITVFQTGKTKKVLSEVNVGNAVLTSLVVANDVLYIANRSTLFAISDGGK
jgi:outer membrane protein assembly factor BamB